LVAASLRRVAPVATGPYGPLSLRARWVTAMQTSTAAAVSGAAGVRCSPRSSTDHTSVSSGWANCNWLAFGMPIAAMPRYQTTRPRNCEPAATHSSPATLCAVSCTGSYDSAIAATGTVSGRHRTSAQPMTCQPGMTRASRPPSV
jgi:hypothetical protein